VPMRPALALSAVALSALALAAPAAGASRPPGVPSLWWHLGVCETALPGTRAPTWDWGKYRRRNEGPRYEGGLGFAASTWRAFRLPGYPVHAYDASPAQQVAVARRLRAWAVREGYGDGLAGWGCARQHPWLRRLPG
jgi:hypothetical protein